jgi:lipoate synthase
MKTRGASQEEIDTMIADFKKKTAALDNTEKTPPEVAALKIEAKQRIAEMKETGASEEEIQKVMAKYKQKIKQLEAKILEKDKQKKKSKKTGESQPEN